MIRLFTAVGLLPGDVPVRIELQYPGIRDVIECLRRTILRETGHDIPATCGGLNGLRKQIMGAVTLIPGDVPPGR